MRKLLIDGKTDVSLDELLQLAEVEPSDYAEAIALSSKGNTIVLKRDPCECNINNYNPAIMKAWGANMDIQYVLKVLSAKFYFHKPITVHLELYLFYCFIHFLLYIGQY